MSKLTPDLQPTPEAMSDDALDCRATAALLRAVAGLVWASHVGAVLAVSCFQWLPLPLWGLVVYFGVRVRLDAELLEMLAGDPEHSPGRLDQWLSRAGLRAPRGERSIGERCQGARRLALWLGLLFLGQVAATAWVLLRSNL